MVRLRCSDPNLEPNKILKSHIVRFLWWLYCEKASAEIQGEFFQAKLSGDFSVDFLGPFSLEKNKRKKSTQKSTAKFKSELGSFTAKVHAARFWPWVIVLWKSFVFVFTAQVPSLLGHVADWGITRICLCKWKYQGGMAPFGGALSPLRRYRLNGYRRDSITVFCDTNIGPPSHPDTIADEPWSFFCCMDFLIFYWSIFCSLSGFQQKNTYTGKNSGQEWLGGGSTVRITHSLFWIQTLSADVRLFLQNSAKLSLERREVCFWIWFALSPFNRYGSSSLSSKTKYGCGVKDSRDTSGPKDSCSRLGGSEVEGSTSFQGSVNPPPAPHDEKAPKTLGSQYFFSAIKAQSNPSGPFGNCSRCNSDQSLHKVSKWWCWWNNWAERKEDSAMTTAFLIAIRLAMDRSAKRPWPEVPRRVVAKGSSISWIVKLQGDKHAEWKLSNARWLRSCTEIKLLTLVSARKWGVTKLQGD